MDSKRKPNSAKPDLDARYANFFEVGHNESEFVLVFGQFCHGNNDARPHTKIITTPSYANELLQVLQEALKRYQPTDRVRHKTDRRPTGA
jgi:hypothetical protein